MRGVGEGEKKELYDKYETVLRSLALLLLCVSINA